MKRRLEDTAHVLALLIRVLVYSIQLVALLAAAAIAGYGFYKLI